MPPPADQTQHDDEQHGAEKGGEQVADGQRADLIALDPDIELAEQRDADVGTGHADDDCAGNAHGADAQCGGGEPAGKSSDDRHDQNLVDTADQAPHLLLETFRSAATEGRFALSGEAASMAETALLPCTAPPDVFGAASLATRPMTLFDHPDFDGHEQVVYSHDDATGLRAIVAIHNTRRGPALGGFRMWPYAGEAAALEDALRLSRGMTYKAAMAGLDLGGGKAVIIGDAGTDKTEALMKAFGRAVDRLNRRYITAEDVGTSVADMDAIKTVTDHVVGVTGGAGDPSNSTAHGVYIGILAAVRHKLGRETVGGLHVAVQGVGNVGRFLCDYLHKAGARLSVTDIDRNALRQAEREFGAAVVGPDEIYDLDCDLFAPCALGAVVNDATLPRLKCAIVAGSANNVLDEERHGAALRRAGILYAPDYVINAGGLIDVARFALGFDIEAARARLHRIDDTLTEIFARAEAEDRPTGDVADSIAEERFR